MTNFKRLTSKKYNLKDSCSFSYKDNEYMMCTNCGCNDIYGGLAVLKLNKKTKIYDLYDIGFPGWTLLWAPFIKKIGNTLHVFFNDTGKGFDDWKDICNNQRLKVTTYNIETKEWGSIEDIIVGDNSFGIIDGFIKKINKLYYMLYTDTQYYTTKKYLPIIPKFIQNFLKIYKEKEHPDWDIYYAISTNLKGPFVNPIKLVNPEVVIEEAANWNGNHIYWSQDDSELNSYIQRGVVVVNSDKSLTLIRDKEYKLEWNKSQTTTHPDSSSDGTIRCTLRELGDGPGRFYIGELVK